MSKNILLVLFFLSSLFGFSQSSYELKGKIIDKKSKLPIDLTTVYITSVKDSTVIDYTISEKSGNFSFLIKKNNQPFVLKVSYLGFHDYKKQISSLDNDLNLGIIELDEMSSTLDEVVIKNEAPPIRIKKDTLEFNASSFKVRPDANVETLLKQLPGVEIDSDGKITVNGKEVKQVLVNGKPFFDADGKIALQNLPSDIIEKVQVTDLKTKQEELAKKTASSNDASINLTIDESKNKGFFGKVVGGYGSDSRYESSLLANYFKNKTRISVLASSNNINSVGFSMDEIFDNMGGGRNNNIYVSDNGSFGIGGRSFGGNNGITTSNLVGINYTDSLFKDFDSTTNYFYSGTNSENENKTKQISFLPTGNFTTESNTKSNDERFSNNITFALEYKIDSTYNFYMRPNFARSNGRFIQKSAQTSKNDLDELLNQSNADIDNQSEGNTFSNEFTFNKSFRRKGRNLSFNFDNENATSQEKNETQSTTLFFQGLTPNDIRNQLGTTKTSSYKYNAKLIYSEPITDSLNVNLSFLASLDNLKNNLQTNDFDSASNLFVLQNSLLSLFTSRNIKSISPRAGFELRKKSFDVNINSGLSVINFDTKANYLAVETVLNRDYILPYFDASFSYDFKKNRRLYFNYDYSWNVPTSEQILPIQNLVNPLNTIVGNPNLDLNKFHNAYFNYSNFDWQTKKGMGIYSGGNFYDNQVVNSTVFTQDRKRITSAENVSGMFNFWAGMYGSKTFKKDKESLKVRLNFNSNISRNKGFTDGVQFTADTYSFSPRLNLNYEYGEFFSVNPVYEYSLNRTNYTNFIVDNASNFVHKLTLQTTNYWPQNWVIGNDFGYTYNSNIGEGFRKDFYLWNTSLSYNFFKKKFIAKIKVYDVLNQNLNTTRDISASFIRDEQNTVLQRYVMFSLTYKLEKFAGKEKKGGMFDW